MSAHTPGPWEITAVENSGGILAILGKDAAGDFLIAEIQQGETPATDRANARLIAAAPDLLKALQAIKEALDTYRRVQDWRPIHFLLENKTLEAAIAKATGEAATS